MPDDERDDPELTAEQLLAVGALNADEIASIDRTLLDQISTHWRKVAMVVFLAMRTLGDRRIPGVPDIFYAERIRWLASNGSIESVGNLRRIRFCEVRRRVAESSASVEKH